MTRWWFSLKSNLMRLLFATLLAALALTPCVARAQADGRDALPEVNAKRASRGLPPFERDEELTRAAYACSAFRAAHGITGHTNDDFLFLPDRSLADATGVGAFPPSYGWMTCCTNESYRRAGAAWVMGTGGIRYMSLFVSGGPAAGPTGPTGPSSPAAPQPQGRRRFRR
jgi:hypothetical protein